MKVEIIWMFWFYLKPALRMNLASWNVVALQQGAKHVSLTRTWTDEMAQK